MPPEIPASGSEALEASLQALYQRRPAGIKLGLATTRALLVALGDPHRRFRCVHVAGTNGKGSVCAMLEAMLRAAGIRTGLYTSPHLVRFNERYQVAGAAISDAELYALLTEVERCADGLGHWPEGHEPTFFEFTTAAALAYFARKEVDVAVIETGLGGRLDATNVVEPMVTAITQIGIDHVAFLGESIADIAREKAGIIKPGRPVVLGALRDDARAVIEAAAAAAHAPVVRADELVSIRRRATGSAGPWPGQVLEIETPEQRYPPVRFPLAGRHQLANLAIAVATAETLAGAGEVDVPPRAVRDGLQALQWPGRGQVLQREPLVLLDVAHNADGAAAACALLDELCPTAPAALVAGLSRDKDAVEFFRAFAGRVQAGWAVSPRHPPGRPAAEAAEAGRLAGLDLTPSTLEEAAAAALAWAEDRGGVVLITGSIYLAEEALRRWSRSHPPPPSSADTPR